MKIAATLILAALVAQSTAFVTKRRNDDTDTLKGFTYTDKDMSLTAPSGNVKFPFFSFIKQTLYTFSIVDGVKQITVETIFPALNFYYPNTKAMVGDVTTEGTMMVFSSNSTYNATISAPGGDDCKLNIKVRSSKMTPTPFFDLLGENGSAFDAKKNDILPTLIDALAELPQIVTKRLQKALQELFGGSSEAKEFCKKLQAATSDDFPTPPFPM